MNPFLVTGKIVLVSAEPVSKEFHFATVGGYSVQSEGQEICFDWECHSGNSELREDGHLVLTWETHDFDKSYFEESNQSVDALDWSNIVNGTLTEVYYENGYIIDGKELYFDMKLQSFDIIQRDEAFNSLQTYSFSEEQINAYNERN